MTAIPGSIAELGKSVSDPYPPEGPQARLKIDTLRLDLPLMASGSGEE
ncbi:hypothetical protein GCM10010335_41490 [Streptomyces galbus]|nr:hypothetical protein GCM10010335_41490 [Streptomyces galbus]